MDLPIIVDPVTISIAQCACRAFAPNALPDHAPAGWRGGDGQEYRVGGRFLGRPGRTDTIRPTGMQGPLPAQPRRGANSGAAAVTRALGSDLGGCRLAGCGWAVVSCASGRPMADKSRARLIRPGTRRRPAQYFVDPGEVSAGR